MKLLCLPLALALSAASFSAQAIQAKPLTTVYSPSTNSGNLTVSNPTALAKTYQVIVHRWDVENGEKVLIESDALRVLPSVFTMEPGKAQTLRWVFQSDGSTEQAYRIRLEEVPDPEVVKQAGIYHALTLQFPWFWRERGIEPELSVAWHGPTLVVTNSGDATAQLSDLVAGSVKRDGLVGYVLPGETARFDLGAKAPVPVSVKVNGKDTTLAVD